MKAQLSSGDVYGAIDPHSHILPQAFIEDLRKGRFGRTVTIERDKGFEWMEKSCSKRESSPMRFTFDWGLDGVHDDPRYLDMLKRVGLD